MNLIPTLAPTKRFGLLVGRSAMVSNLAVWVSAALLIVVTAGCDTNTTNSWQPKSVTASPTIQMVDVIEVALTDDAYQAISFMGTLKPRRSIPLAFTQGGRVAVISVTSGQQVTADQLLAKTETAELDARKATVETALQSTRQRFNANQNSTELRTQISDLQRELKEIEQGISSATITAPFAGVVTKRSVEQGQVVSTGMPVFDLVDSENLMVEVKVATRIANGINPGETVWVLIQGQPFAAAVEAVLPTMQGATRTRTVTLEFRDNRTAQLFNSGEGVEISYWTKTENSGIWLPYAVLQRHTTGLWSAMVAETGEETGPSVAYVRLRTLDVIQLHDDLALVQGALGQGDRVIINGLNRIVPGQKIQATLVENGVVVPSPAQAPSASDGSDGSLMPRGTLP